MLNSIKGFFKETSPEQEHKKQITKTLKKTLKYHFEYTYPLITDRLFLGGSGFAVKKITQKLINNQDALSNIKRKFSKQEDYENIKDFVESIDFKDELDRILEMDSRLENEKILHFLLKKRKKIQGGLVSSDIKQLIKEYLNSIKNKRNQQDFDILDKTFTQLEKSHCDMIKLYQILLNFREKSIYLPKRFGSFFILKSNDFNYIYTTPKITLRKLWLMSSNVDNVKKYKIITMDVAAYNKWIKEIRLFTEIDLSDLNRVSVPYLKSHIFSVLLDTKKTNEIEDLKITIPSAGKDQNSNEAILVQSKYKGSFRMLSKDELEIVVDENSLRSDINILGGSPKGNVSDISLNVGGCVFRGVLTTNAEGVTLVIRKTDGLPMSREKIKQAAGLSDEELDKVIIKTDLVDDNKYRDKQEYNKKKQEFNSKKLTYLDPLQEKDNYTFPDYYSVPYEKRLVDTFLNSFDNSRGGLYFVTGPMGSWKSSTVQQLFNKLIDEKIEKDYSNYNIFTLENPVEKRNRHFTHLKVDDTMDDKQYNRVVKGLKRNNVEICFIGELRGAEVYGAISDVSKSLPVILTYHVNSIANFFTNFVDYLGKAQIRIRGELERLKMIAVHARVETEKDLKRAETTDTIKGFLKELKTLFDYNKENKQHQKIFDLLKTIGQNALENDNKFLINTSSDTGEKLLEEDMTATSVKRWLRNIGDIEDIDFATVYNYVNLERTLLYKILDLICKGKVQINQLPLNDYATQTIIDILTKYKKDHVN